MVILNKGGGEMTENFRQSRNYAVSLSRVAGMVMIVLCHYTGWLGLNAVSQFMSIGVMVFIFISGYLYSEKDIKPYPKWLAKRYLKITVPAVMAVTVYAAVLSTLAKSAESMKHIWIYLINVQGIEFVIGKIKVFNYDGMGPLWFITVIVICYLMLIILKSAESKNKMSKKSFALCFALFAAASVGLCYAGVFLNYFLVFFLGYGLKRFVKDITRKQYLLLSAAMVLSIALRLIGKKYLDGGVTYSSVIVSLSGDVVAVWIFYTFVFFDQKYHKTTARIVSSKLFSHIDAVSFYVFLTHAAFLSGKWNASNLVSGKLSATLLFLLLTVVSAEMLYVINYFLQRAVLKRKTAPPSDKIA